jgi:hypothetical protein
MMIRKKLTQQKLIDKAIKRPVILILNTCRRFLQVGKASKEYYIQFCQERVYREREVLLILNVIYETPA